MLLTDSLQDDRDCVKPRFACSRGLTEGVGDHLLKRRIVRAALQHSGNKSIARKSLDIRGDQLQTVRWTSICNQPIAQIHHHVYSQIWMTTTLRVYGIDEAGRQSNVGKNLHQKLGELARCTTVDMLEQRE